MNLLYVFMGGGLGAVSRVALTSMAPSGDKKYLYTMIVNILGSFLIGLAIGLFETIGVGRQWRDMAVAGFLGGFTTFSTFAFDIVDMMQRGLWGRVMFYVVMTVGVSLMACAVGMWLVKIVMPTR